MPSPRMPDHRGPCRELRQLFNAIDPSPFRQRDLDPRAEEFIVEWGGDFQPMRRLPRRPSRAGSGPLGQAAMLAKRSRVLRPARQAPEEASRAVSSRQNQSVDRAGVSRAVDGDRRSTRRLLAEGRLADVVREGFLIGGWVAMWRPLEVFLYDWWPIRAKLVSSTDSARCPSGSSTTISGYRRLALGLARGARR